MTKKIKKKELNNIVGSIIKITSDKSKNIVSLRCEKIGKKINEISKKLNEEILEINSEHASTDKDNNFLHEEVVTTEKNGHSRKENNGSYKYTFKRDQDRKKEIEKFWNEEIELPVSVVDRENHPELYKKIITEHSFTTLSNLAGIILDIPIGEDGFVDEEWILGFLETENKIGSNGQEKAAAAHV